MALPSTPVRFGVSLIAPPGNTSCCGAVLDVNVSAIEVSDDTRRLVSIAVTSSAIPKGKGVSNTVRYNFTIGTDERSISVRVLADETLIEAFVADGFVCLCTHPRTHPRTHMHARTLCPCDPHCAHAAVITSPRPQNNPCARSQTGCDYSRRAQVC